MSTARNVIIVHGCPSSYEQSLDATTRTYDKHRMPWIEKEIGNIGGGVVYRPLMPKPRERIYAMFEQEFEKYNIVINEQSVLIGHSC
ncbi:MAG: hypothetical protein LBI53_03090 [Candidatus Peribacteria bacterium]|jgi:hypothetical protein|nr:hypothetical protein [Candidatus Peribacteria bacterium]